MIKKIKIKNFKGIKEAEIEFKPITLLFGPNSSGKSSLIHAFLYLQEVLERWNLDANFTTLGGDYINLGGFKNIVYLNDLNNTITLSLEAEVFDDLPYPKFTSNQDKAIKLFEEISVETETVYLTIEIKWNEELGRPIVKKYEIGINGELISSIVLDKINSGLDFYAIKGINIESKALPFVYDEGLRETMLSIMSGNHSEFKLEIANLVSALPSWDIPIELNLDFIKLAVTDSPVSYQEIATYFNVIASLFNSIGKLFITELNGFTYLGPIREVPKRNFEPHSVEKKERWYNGMAAWDNLSQKFSVIGGVNKWLEKINAGYQIELFEYLEHAISKSVDKTNVYERNRNDIYQLFEQLKESFIDYNENREIKIKDKLLKIITLLFKDEIKDISINELLIKDKPQIIYELLRTIQEEYKEKLISKLDILFEENSFEAPMYYNVKINNAKNEFLNDYQKKNHNILGDNKIIRRIQLIDVKKNIKLLPKDVGVGISQMLPVIVLALSPYKSFCAIEQPELHIHPAFQVELGDLFIEESKKLDKIFLIETHSEHLMLRLLRRIEESYKNKKDLKYKLTPDKLNVQYVYKKYKITTYKQLRIDKTGEFIDDWPDGFFEEREEELFPDD